MTEARTRTRVPGPTMATAQEAPTGNLPATRQQNGGAAQQRTAVYEEPTTQESASRTTAQPVSSATFPQLAAAIAAVMSDLQPVSKEGTNTHFGYRYAKMQDILQGLTPLLGKHGLAIIPAEAGEAKFGGKHVYVKYGFTILHKSGEIWAFPTTWTGMSMAYSERGNFDDKCINKCAVAARKSFLQALFNIPTEDADDPDRGDNDYAAGSQQRQRAPSPHTGKVEPHHIKPNKSTTLKGWAKQYVDFLKLSTSTEELNQWDKLNEGLLITMSQKDAATYNMVVDQYELLQKAVAVEPTQRSQQATTGVDKMPDVKADPEAFIAWAERMMATAVNIKALDNFYNTVIEPVRSELFPPDQQALVEIYERNHQRIEPDQAE